MIDSEFAFFIIKFRDNDDLYTKYNAFQDIFIIKYKLNILSRCRKTRDTFFIKLRDLKLERT